MRTLRIRMAMAAAATIIGVMAGVVSAGADSPEGVPPGQEGKIPVGDWNQDQIDTALRDDAPRPE